VVSHNGKVAQGSSKSEFAMSQQVAQDNLEAFREWYKINHKLREEETARLELKLREVERELEQAEEARKRIRLDRDKLGWGRQRGEPLNPSEWEAERYYQGLWEWKWKIERRLRELIRWEREDLEWLGRLEGRQRARDRANRGEHVRGRGGNAKQSPQAPTRKN